jgi:hypothetical protein
MKWKVLFILGFADLITSGVSVLLSTIGYFSIYNIASVGMKTICWDKITSYQ